MTAEPAPLTPLARTDFAAFFLEVRGYAPFAWQERLLDHVVSEGRWPAGLDAPTGSGKTAVVDIHVFANALHATGSGPRVPRRLAFVVDRRVLVDHHHDHASSLGERLAAALTGADDAASTSDGGDAVGPTGPTDGQRVVRAVARALADLVPAPAAGRSRGAVTPLQVVTLRGGLPAPREWRIEPEVCSVVASTPDMWGSRLLMRGYGTGRRARPQEAALLAVDCVAVVDEAHLARQAVLTARRVAELVALRPPPGAVPPLQVVETTATPGVVAEGPGREVVGVVETDLETSAALRNRLTRPKPMALLGLAAWPAAGSEAGKQQMARTVVDEVARLIDRVGPAAAQLGLPPTVGCVMNRVDDAAAVAAEARRRGIVTVLLTGRVRGVDRARLATEHPCLLSIDGDAGVALLVATQALEVGVDVDLAALVTEVAPATALAQRVGRVNRTGRRAEGPVTIVVPASGQVGADDPHPYVAADITASLSWLERFVDDPIGITPWRLRSTEDRAPGPQRRRDLYQRLGITDVVGLARTSGAGFTEHDLDLWLSDDLEPDTTIGVVLRRTRWSGEREVDPSEALPVLRLTPPLAHESLPLPRSALRRLLERYLRASTDPATSAPVHRYRASTTDTDEQAVSVCEVPHDAEPARKAQAVVAQFRAGDVIILDAGQAGDDVRRWSPVPAPDLGATDLDPLDAYELDDAADPGARHLRVGDLAVVPDVGGGVADAARALSVPAGAPPGSEDDPDLRRARLGDALESLVTSAPRALRARIVEVSRRVRDGTDVRVVAPDPDDGTATTVFLDTRSRLPGEDRLQTWSTSPGPVLLADHQHAVAERVEASACALGLPLPVVEDLRLAALHHDDGKTDPRFQQDVLGTPATAPQPWAKSGRRALVSPPPGAARLPRGWRHEQLSVLLATASPDLQGRQPGRRDLVLRLIGTTHGLGRPSFPHDSRDLLSPGGPDPTAAALFDEGGWEALTERTDAAHGPWVVAYLEMLLRAADARVSREGS